MFIRRYYGHDCDSVNGFNDGYYIDREPIEVADIGAAYDACMAALEARRGFEATHAEEVEGGYEVVTGYYDKDGAELTLTEWTEANANDEAGCYRYVFVTFEEVEP